MYSRVTGCASLSDVNSGSIDPGLVSEVAIACTFSRVVTAEVEVRST
jgi:hypothetical protein